jgi:hypothetical protein
LTVIEAVHPVEVVINVAALPARGIEAWSAVVALAAASVYWNMPLPELKVKIGDPVVLVLGVPNVYCA